MSLDGITIRSIVYELKEKIINGKIQKINQINENLLILNIYKNKNYKLLISSNSQDARIHFTKLEYENPMDPPNFCMVLRKHIQGSTILDIEQNGLDRTVIITVSSRNELGDISNKKLIIDIMNKYSNIVLVKSDNTVIEAIKRVSHDMSSVRAIYPGTKFNLLEDNKVDITKKFINISELNFDNPKMKYLFYTNYTGFSPTISNELLYISQIESKDSYLNLNNEKKDLLDKNFKNLSENIIENKFEPYIFFENDKIINYYCFDLHLGNKRQKFDSISEAMDIYYKENVNDNSTNQKKSNLYKIVSQLISKKENKLNAIKNDIEKSKNFDDYKIQADILSVNTQKITKGMKNINLLNYYTGEEILIDLDTKKSAWENINLKYKQSKKLNKTYHILIENLPNLEEEIKYLSGILYQIEKIDNITDIIDIRNELEQAEYIKKLTNKNSKKENSKSKPILYTHKNFSIYIGKNNKQNEEITLKIANKEDYFFHIKNLPGAHLILKTNDTPNDELIYTCGFLAGKYSKNSNDRYMDIDYTLKKNVFKIKGSKPGMVHYTNFKTIRIDLENDPDLLKDIILQNKKEL